MNEPQSVQTDAEKDAKDNKLFAIIGYIPILFLVPYLAAKESAFAQYHANQGALLTLLYVVGVVIGYIIPFIGGLIQILINIFLLAFFIIGVINVSNSTKKPLPIIGEIKLLK